MLTASTIAARQLLTRSPQLAQPLTVPTRSRRSAAQAALLLSGRRPDASRSWNFINHFREDHPEWTSLPGLFLRAGRLALGSGKVYHPKLPPAYDGDKSWSAEALPYRNPCWNTADDTNASFQDGGLPCIPCLIDIKGYLFHDANISVVDDYCEGDALEDTFTVSDAIRLLRKVGSKPFYLAVGLHKPHLPWQASSDDFDKHPLSGVELPTHKTPPLGMPSIAFHFTDEKAHVDPWSPIDDNGMRKARRAYYAAVTGMDRKLGKLLDELKVLHLDQTTAVVLHGDHGWHLGEGGEWRKFTNFELATRVPLIIYAPWLHHRSNTDEKDDEKATASAVDATTAPNSHRSAELVELVDLYPTIAELAGIPLPANETFDGVSLVPLLHETRRVQQEWTPKAAAFSQYPRRVKHPGEAWKGNSIIHHERRTFTHMGYSARTASFRYTEWVEWNQSSLQAIWSRTAAVELYDHRGEVAFPTDFNVGESENVANRSEFAAEVKELAALVRRQFSQQ